MSSHTEPNARAAVQAVRRANVARGASWLAVALGLALVAVFLYQAGLFAYLTPHMAPPQPHIDNPGQVTSSGSTLTGKDNGGNPYEITAEHVAQDKDTASIFYLEKMTGVFHRASGAPYRVSADTARYDSRAKTADLKGSVTLVEEGRLTARMSEASVDLGGKTLTANVPVTVDLGHGKIEANGLKIVNDGSDILFLNGVKAHFADGGGPQGANP